MPHPHDSLDVWSVEGRFQHLVYSPKGGVEGVLIDTDGVPTQFVFPPHDDDAATAFAGLKSGQALVIEGIEEGPPPKGGAEHAVYRFERLASVEGKAPREADTVASVDGKVVRFNYARHGQANGVVLDTGDFVHTKPHGLASLALKVDDKVHAAGRVRWLITGEGRVLEATQINGHALG